MHNHNIYREFEPYINDCTQEEKNYIENRLLNQIIWYDIKANKNKKLHTIFNSVSIIITSSITVLSLLSNCKYQFYIAIIIALLSSTSSILISILNFFECHKLWINYRSTCESLKSILYKYFTKTDIFKNLPNKDALAQLISICEEHFLQEYKTWNKIFHTKKEQ